MLGNLFRFELNEGDTLRIETVNELTSDLNTLLVQLEKMFRRFIHGSNLRGENGNDYRYITGTGNPRRRDGLQGARDSCQTAEIRACSYRSLR